MNLPILRPSSVKTTFETRFDKAIKFYDFMYHVHKSTYKGLASFYKLYSQIERTYADSLINLTKQAWAQMPELPRENPAMSAVIKQVINCIQTSSQLHFNYSERLIEVGSFYNGEYSSSKRKKDNLMKMIKDRSEEEYTQVKDRERANRASVVAKEKQICKNLHHQLDQLAQEETDRVHKVKEQTIIYFSLYKKVCEKELECTSDFNTKLIQQEVAVKNSKICEISEELRAQYNQYGGDQLQRKSYDLTQPLAINRESLRASMLMKERVSRISDVQDKVKKIVDKYKEAPDNLLITRISGQGSVAEGIFIGVLFSKEAKRKYARQINGQMIRSIAFDMIAGFYKSVGASSDDMMLLQLMRASLKIKSGKAEQFNSRELQTYLDQVQNVVSSQEYLFHIRFLQQISQLGQNRTQYALPSSYQTLDRLIQRKELRQIENADIVVGSINLLSESVKCCLLDILLDCVRDNSQTVLIEGFVDFMHIVGRFAEQFMSLQRDVVVKLILTKISRLIWAKDSIEELELLLNDSYFMTASLSHSGLISKQLQAEGEGWSTALLNSCTSHLMQFPLHPQNRMVNCLKLLLLLEKTRLISNFNARDHFNASIRCAGFRYLQSSPQCQRMFDGEIAVGDQRLKNIVQGIEELDFEGVIKGYIDPTSAQIAKLMSVGEKKVKLKLIQQFTYPVYEILNANLNLLSEQQGVDREGYILRLGIVFSKLDIENPQPLLEYETFFKVLKSYLEATEKDYDSLLEHSRKTELWIMEDNALATTNCIDFCSLLYKPFEFLLISLKELEKSKNTEYTAKYSEYIKLRLNTVLKNQIIKYVNFLNESLTNYPTQTSQLMLKPRRLERANQLTIQSQSKQRQSFKELTRRLFNLLFLREQLEEMVCDFLEPEIYKKLDNSVFNIDKLNKISTQYPQYRDILGNIREIAEGVAVNQEKIIKRVACITVVHCMGKLWENLYYQEEKNAIEEFFSSAGDYKLSDHTFLKYQQVIEDWLSLLSKNIPTPFIQTFQVNFCRQIFLCTELQILNSTKFKLPLKATNVIPYLDSDVTFLTTMMKSKFFQLQIIEEEIKIPLRHILGDLQTDTSKLIAVFETATLKNDKDKCKYILVVLNLRVKEQKALDFVKKYKSIVWV